MSKLEESAQSICSLHPEIKTEKDDVQMDEESYVNSEVAGMFRFESSSKTENQKQNHEIKIEEGSPIQEELNLEVTIESKADCSGTDEFENCGKSYSDTELVPTTNTRYEYLKLHTGLADFECEHCGKKFNRTCDFKIHLRVHTQETPYECENCGKKFTQSGNMKMHVQRVHTQNKPFACGHCEKKYKRKDQLKEHLMLHTGESPFECEYCGKKFRRPFLLKEHVRLHTGETPYECEQCGKKFHKSRVFKGHMKGHECENCGRKFSEKGNLKRHMKIHT